MKGRFGSRGRHASAAIAGDVIVKAILAIGLLASPCLGCGGSNGQSAIDGDADRTSPTTFYDCTAKDSSGKLVNIGKRCASTCQTQPSGNGFDWLYADNNGTCVQMDITLGVCNWATVDTCGSTMGSTCTAADSGVSAHCGT